MLVIAVFIGLILVDLWPKFKTPIVDSLRNSAQNMAQNIYFLRYGEDKITNSSFSTVLL